MTSFYAKQITTRHIVIIIYPGVTLLDATGPAQVFHSASSAIDGHATAYQVTLASTSGGLIASDTGITLATESLSYVANKPIDTLLVAGGDGVFNAADDIVLVNWLREQAPKARRAGSTCMGAFMTAAAGLLDGRRAVTHWRWCDTLQQRYPAITVEHDPIFIRDDPMWSSAGASAGIDMALAMVEADLGHQVALAAARALVVFFKRPGGQSQFSAALHAQTTDRHNAFDRLHLWIVTHLDADLRVERLAGYIGMSPRNFSRRYTEQMGISPAKAVEKFRLEAARRMLEESTLTISTVANRCGFGDDERMRRVFIRQLGIAPMDYRRRFGQLLAP